MRGFQDSCIESEVTFYFLEVGSLNLLARFNNDSQERAQLEEEHMPACASARVSAFALTMLLISSGKTGTFAHPGSGIAVDAQGRVSFTDTGRGIWRVDGEGKLTLISKSAMHWMAIDPKGYFADSPDEFGEWFGRLTPRGEKPTLISCSDF